MASKCPDRSKTRPKSPRQPQRSISPNNVVIANGTGSENPSLPVNNSFPKKTLILDNIMEESDPTIPINEVSQENVSIPLENAVKIADKNVQRFIEEMSNDSQNLPEFKAICTASQEELKGLSSFLSTMDDESRNKIVDTLISVYKKEISSSANNNVKRDAFHINKGGVYNETDDKIGKFKNVCKGLISEYKSKPIPNRPTSPKNRNEAIFGSELNDPSLAQNVKNIFEENNFIANYNIKNETFLEKNNNDFDENTPHCSWQDNDYNVLNDSYESWERVFNYNYKNFERKTEAKSSDLRTSDQNFNPFSADIFNKKQLNIPKENESYSFEVNPPSNSPGTSGTPINFKICPSKEDAINRILGRKQKENISSVKYTTLEKGKNTNMLSDTAKSRSKKNIVTFYEELKKATEDPTYADRRTFKSEGVQVSYEKSRKSYKLNNYIHIVKPYKYHPKYIWESKSDIAIECPYGCLLKIRKSKSDTDLDDSGFEKRKYLTRESTSTKRRGKLTKSESKTGKSISLIKIDVKPSIQLLEAKTVRRKKQMIEYLEDDLKRGDSEFQVSQVLFETPVKNIDNDASSLVIPALDEKQLTNFNANYLLHAIKIQKKSDILPAPNFSSPYFNHSASNPSITEEDYKTWLKKQNWAKYSKTAKDLQSTEDLRSISQTVHQPSPPKDTCGEFGYYLKRGDFSPRHSTVEQASTLISDLCDLLLYEHVVISKAINFCCSFNAQRVKIISTKDRFLQIMCFALFYGIWVFLDNYVFIPPEPKGRRMLWK